MKKQNFTSEDFKEIESLSSMARKVNEDLKSAIIDKLKKLVKDCEQNYYHLELYYLIKIGEIVAPVVALFMEGEDLMFKLDMDINEFEVEPADAFKSEDLLEFFNVLSLNLQQIKVDNQND